ncbi:cupin domain-containing protein [Sagittula sp. S175]|uniref:cupin domain-containing protein n=1 Tax=Sagittula sp. S175 TaxID=3415129 RepID=UPI003C7D8F40
MTGMNDATAMMQFDLTAAMLQTMPVIANADHAPLEGGEDPAFGTVRWKTLFDGDKTATSSMVPGVAEFGPEGTLLPHRHTTGEIYFGLSGSGVVTIDGVAHEISPGVALYVHSDAGHGTVAGPVGVRLSARPVRGGRIPVFRTGGVTGCPSGNMPRAWILSRQGRVTGVIGDHDTDSAFRRP